MSWSKAMKNLRDVVMDRIGSKGSKGDVLFTFRLSILETDGFWRLDSNGFVYADTSQADAEQMPNTVFGLGGFLDDEDQPIIGIAGNTPDGQLVWFTFTLDNYLIAGPWPASQMNVVTLGPGGANTYISWSGNNCYLEWGPYFQIMLGGTEKNDNNSFFITSC
jgi:hypothetical protein